MIKIKNKLIIIIIYLLFFLAGDIIFSNFIYKKDVAHNCYKYLEKFYYLKENCYSKEKWIKKIISYDVYIDKNGFRYSGKKNKNKDNVVAFLGGSFTYGLGHSYEKSFVGIINESKKNFNIINLGVPGYSPSVFTYQLKKLLDKNLNPKKIFLVLDLIDVHNEASRWEKSLNNKQPTMVYKTNVNKEKNNIENFKEQNFKGSRLIARSINNFFRSIRLKISESKEQSLKPGFSGWGDFTHRKIEDTNKKLWEPFGFREGLRKIEKSYSKVSFLAKSINSEIYIILYPWPDTLEYGQKSFNWENFGTKLCKDISCTKLLNLFPDFLKIKNNDKNWLTYLYIDGDLHLTQAGQRIIANKIINEGF